MYNLGPWNTLNQDSTVLGLETYNLDYKILTFTKNYTYFTFFNIRSRLLWIIYLSERCEELDDVARLGLASENHGASHSKDAAVVVPAAANRRDTRVQHYRLYHKSNTFLI